MEKEKPSPGSSKAANNNALPDIFAQKLSLATSSVSGENADVIVARISQLCKSWYLELQQLTVDAFDVNFDEIQKQCVQNKFQLLQSGISQLCNAVAKDGDTRPNVNDVLATFVQNANENGGQRRFDRIIDAIKSSSGSQASLSSTPTPKVPSTIVYEDQPQAGSSASSTNGRNYDDYGRRRIVSGDQAGKSAISMECQRHFSLMRMDNPPPVYSAGAPPSVRPPIPLPPVLKHDGAQLVDDDINDAKRWQGIKLRVEYLPQHTEKHHLTDYFSQFGRVQMAQAHNNLVMQMRRAYHLRLPPGAPIVWGFVVMSEVAEVCQILRHTKLRPHNINGVNVVVKLYRSKEGAVDNGIFLPVRRTGVATQQARQVPARVRAADTAATSSAVAAASTNNVIAHGNSIINTFTLHASNIPTTLPHEVVKRLFELHGGALEKIFISEPSQNGPSSSSSVAKCNGGFAHLKFAIPDEDQRLLQREYIWYDHSMFPENAAGVSNAGTWPQSKAISCKITVTPFVGSKGRNANAGSRS